MFASTILLLFSLSPLLSYAQNSSSTVVCVPGLCLQGYSNTTIGAKFSAPNTPSSLHLLPGLYTDQTNPQYVHDVITSPSVSISPSSGFSSSSNLPINLSLRPGLAIYAGTLYSGQSAFSDLPSAPVVDASVPLSAKALALSTNVVATVNTGSNNRLVLWDSIPDTTQLPVGASGSLTLTNLESVACSPACAGSGICSSSGKCQCAAGFTGESCERCAPGFFGPNCQACPANCDSCDEGISGTGRCLKPVIENAPSTCNCLNGVCGANGQCACTTGFETATGGTACGKCAPGFFLTSTGDCKVCGLGCTQCADTTGNCLSCKSGFTQDTTDKSKCNPPQQATSNGQLCPQGSFANGNQCSVCDSACESCTGPTSNDCAVCARGRYLFNGACVGTNTDGVCDGSTLIADNIKKECDSCGAKCTSCRIPNFDAASTVDQRQCSGCLPGFFLSNGQCVEACPEGTFVSSRDNLTCTACDSSCKSCAGASTFCTSCSNNQLASNGKCVGSCPSGTFSSSGSCLTCHPDCASCSGGAFNQCTACPASRPVLLDGRCLPRCSKTQFFDSATSSCQSCDSSCSSCSGPGPSNCLACSSDLSVLRKGTCLAANCEGAISVIPGLGVCLSELVVVPKPSGTSDPPPLPTVTGLNSPTTTPKRRLEWWQILLMALGCAFIFLMVVWCFRRRQKKKRSERTALFAAGAIRSRGETSWRWRLIRWGEKLFGHKKSVAHKKLLLVPSRPIPIDEFTNDAFKMNDLRAAEEGSAGRRYSPAVPLRPPPLDQEEEDLIKLIGSYNQNRKAPEPSRYLTPTNTPLRQDRRPLSGSSQLSADSIYSQMTGVPRRGPEPRQPVKRELTSKFSMSTMNSQAPSSRELERKPKHGSKNPFWK